MLTIPLLFTEQNQDVTEEVNEEIKQVCLITYSIFYIFIDIAMRIYLRETLLIINKSHKEKISEQVEIQG